MCGIAGFIGFKDNQLLAQKANVIQAHRGPDNQSVWADDYLALAHQRLSIIDLNERSNQPFEKHGLVMIYNGEVYNYQSIKERLEKEVNSVFRTDSDTEVIIEAYFHYKEKCLDWFEGMFAFAIYDTQSHELFLARDHFGIKPIFYTQINESFAFSSELKTLVDLPDFDKTINFNALVKSVNYLWVSGNETMFNGCFKLPPAHYITIGADKKVEIKQYWEVEDATNKNLSEENWIDKVEVAIKKTVQKHMIADVPVSAFLSGGLDSSIITVLAKEFAHSLSTYTISISSKDKKGESMPDDEKYAKKLAEIHKFDYHGITLTSDIIKMLPEMVRMLDEPIGDPAALNTFLMCKEAKSKGVKVLLSGMGADEIFFGYRRHKAIMLVKAYQKIPKLLRDIIFKLANHLPVKMYGKGIVPFRWTKRFLSFASLPIEDAYMRSYSYYDRGELSELFKPNIKDNIDRLYTEHRSIYNSKFNSDVINQVCNTDINMFMLGLNLTYTDRASMAASVEVRVPYIDREVVKLAMQIPGKEKYKHGELKYILKKSAEKILPREIIYRPKASFGAPLRSWISGELSPMVKDLLSEENINKRGVFNYQFIKNMIEDNKKGSEDYSYQIYQLLTVELWFRHYVD